MAREGLEFQMDQTYHAFSEELKLIAWDRQDINQQQARLKESLAELTEMLQDLEECLQPDAGGPASLQREHQLTLQLVDETKRNLASNQVMLDQLSQNERRFQHALAKISEWKTTLGSQQNGVDVSVLASIENMLTKLRLAH